MIAGNVSSLKTNTLFSRQPCKMAKLGRFNAEGGCENTEGHSCSTGVDVPQDEFKLEIFVLENAFFSSTKFCIVGHFWALRFTTHNRLFQNMIYFYKTIEIIIGFYKTLSSFTKYNRLLQRLIDFY